MTRQRLRGLLALLGLAAVMVAMPWLLIWAATHIIVRFNLATPGGIWDALTSRDDGTLALWLFIIVGGIAWAILAGAIILDIVSRLRHVTVPQLRGLAVPQMLAHALVAAVIAAALTSSNGSAALQAIAAPGPQPTDTGGSHSARPTSPQAAPRVVEAKPDIYVVKKGDTLWDIADDKLGDPLDYPRIFKASRHTVQPDGRHLVDPDLIYPGWKLTLPDQEPRKPDNRPSKTGHQADDKETPSPAPVPATPAASSTPIATPSGSTAPTSRAQPTQQPDIEAADEPDESAPLPWMLAGLSGAGALLAGGMWLWLRRRRAAQYRFRRPGRTITVPAEPGLAVVEQTLRHQGDLTSELVDRIAQTTQRLAAQLRTSGSAIPTLRAIDVTTEHLTFRFGDPLDLPAPWEPGDSRQEWRIATDTDPDLIGAWNEEHEPVWPTLVTLGQDDRGWRMVNIEALGVITLTGDRVNAQDLVRSWIAELTVAHWGRDIEIAVGTDPIDGLASLARNRLFGHRAGEDATASFLEAAQKHSHWLAADNLPDMDTARAAQAGPELWRPHLLLTTAADVESLDELIALVAAEPGQTGITILQLETNDPAVPGTEIRLTPDGRVQMPALGLDLVANGMTADEAEGCATLMTTAFASTTDAAMPDAAEPGAEWQEHCDAAGHLHTDLIIPRGTAVVALSASSLLPEPDATYMTQTANTADDLAELAPLVPAETTEIVKQSDPALDQDLAEWRADTANRPRLTVLGPVRLRLGRGGQPSMGVKRVAFYTEITAYLATRPHGATMDELITALGLTADRIRVDLHTLRARLGINPATDRYFVPNASDNPEAHVRNEGIYLVQDLLCDADLFRRLRVRGESAGSAGIDDLAEALRLVTGAPYEQLRRRGGLWMAASRDDQHLLVAIVDVAHLLTTHALATGDLRRARAAAELAHAIAPAEVTPQVDLAVIAEHEGDPDAADQVAHDAFEWLDGTGEGPMDVGERADAILRAHHRLERKGRAG
jgi:hypothetical protein